MSVNCVFCQIAQGVAPAHVVGRWTDTIAITPINPVTPGHVLVLPRRHVSDALVDDKITAITMRRAVQLAKQLHLDDFNLITSTGIAATQTVFHLHIHLVPRLLGDGLALPWTDQTRVQERASI